MYSKISGYITEIILIIKAVITRLVCLHVDIYKEICSEKRRTKKTF